MSILLPLYIYPSAGAWNPLYTAAAEHPDISFTVIINPCSGPCRGSRPDQVYLNEIPKLKSFGNIRTLGYVATNYTSKAIDDVLADVNAWADWPKVFNNTKLKTDGVFFDETPSVYDLAAYRYLEKASRAVKNGTRFRDRFVVHNPGFLAPSIISDKQLLQHSYINLTDITVVFEETFDKFLLRENFDALQHSKVRRSKLAIILHSLPDLSKRVLDYVVEQVQEGAEWLFLTDVKVKDEYYHTFSPIFEDVVRSVDGGAE
ncbi:hypothetical protein K458DRAFT_390806 [Lentithecium fluviatile CBS 122367]|uniref:Cell surface protein n=1 Tax=Lentithecium fluviatile CBS 122367 TaxID=1168545 RepID=A0A6G1IVN8_9PLEO|nr:hypothetical protein K458DRAFT_390806 [Lentithecium fluviatile CBS 122367]